MSSFENLRVVDNFYQTSPLFPMPTVLISTLCEDGSTNLGPYHDFNDITSQFGAHFILRVDKILMKKKYLDAIINDKRSKEKKKK